MLTRLHLTWAHTDRAAHLEPLATFHEPLNGFPNYRVLQHETEDPCVPFIGMYLTDLMHVNEHFPDNAIIDDKPSPNMINFTKRQKLVEVVDTLLRHQSKDYTFQDPEDPELVALIETNLSQAVDVDQAALWKSSQELHRAELIHADIRKGLEAAGF